MCLPLRHVLRHLLSPARPGWRRVLCPFLLPASRSRCGVQWVIYTCLSHGWVLRPELQLFALCLHASGHPHGDESHLTPRFWFVELRTSTQGEKVNLFSRPIGRCIISRHHQDSLHQRLILISLSSSQLPQTLRHMSIAFEVAKHSLLICSTPLPRTLSARLLGLSFAKPFQAALHFSCRSVFHVYAFVSACLLGE